MVAAISPTSQSRARELCRSMAPIGRPPGRVRGAERTARTAARSIRWRRSGQRPSAVTSREVTGIPLVNESRAGPAPRRSWAVASPRPGGPEAAAQRSTWCSSASMTSAPWARSTMVATSATFWRAAASPSPASPSTPWSRSRSSRVTDLRSIGTGNAASHAPLGRARAVVGPAVADYLPGAPPNPAFRGGQASWAARSSGSVTGRWHTKCSQTYAVARPSSAGRSASSGTSPWAAASPGSAAARTRLGW